MGAETQLSISKTPPILGFRSSKLNLQEESVSRYNARLGSIDPFRRDRKGEAIANRRGKELLFYY